VLISPRSPLAMQIRGASGWKLAYEDRTAVIFVREPG